MNESLLASRLKAIEAGAKNEAQVQQYLSRMKGASARPPMPVKAITETVIKPTNTTPGKPKSLSELVAELNAIDAPTDRTLWWRENEQLIKAAQQRELYFAAEGAKSERRPRYGPFANPNQK
jgi:hypothetical protein